MSRARYWLETPGARLPLHAGGALLGRSVDCDVVIADERVSRHHAIVRVVEDGIEVVPLGGAVTRDGALVEGVARLIEGDAFGVFEHRFVLRSAPEPPAEPAVMWFIERDRGVLVPLGDGRFTVGGGADDRLQLPTWEPGAVALERMGETLVAEVIVDDVTTDRPRALGDVVTLASGATVTHRGVSIRVLALPTSPSKPTHRTIVDELPTAVSLALLPRGGRLTVTVGARSARVYLADKRCDLLAILLQPPTPYVVGELLPDETIVARLWPGGRGDRTDINTLVWRIRKDLAAAELGGAPLLDRSNGGLTLRLAARAQVSIS